MSNLMLDSLTLYELNNISTTINVKDKQLYPKVRLHTQIVGVFG